MNEPASTFASQQHHPVSRDLLDICKLLVVFLLILGLFSPTTVLAGDVFKGEALYQTHCELCHGANGRPVTPDAPNFTRGDGLIKPDAALSKTIRFGKNAMPSFEGVLSEKEIFDVISYLRTLY